MYTTQQNIEHTHRTYTELAKSCLVVTDEKGQPASQQPAASSQQPAAQKGAGGRGEALRYIRRTSAEVAGRAKQLSKSFA